ncbi:hypothetical protein AcdelDRAFT_0900 [Acidovorax delafieldii 2AN]|uniref:Uncharacterized protein n=1 Tax=Acidovorax delafieldii 2AN TaxID=573060 RepID=C5T1X0_ACIDE|nr:hypothetical protein [Acidovorax delafieldii]EER61565.1 hypothetical protein AcdelDRAFT_0900 [Acidovorax delafieldii 2AN]
MSQSVLVRTPNTTAVTVVNERAVVVSRPDPFSTVVMRGVPGTGGASGALLAVNRLSEFDTEQKKADARANIGLAVIDGGTFF